MVKGQTPCDSTPVNCIWDITQNHYIFSEIDSAKCTGESCSGQWKAVVYGASPFGSTTPGLKDVIYHNDVNDNGVNCISGGDDCQITLGSLYYYAYFPKHNYTYTSGGCNSKLPCIILFHAGGYSDCSSIDEGEAIKIMAREYAKKGFVAIVAEYRRGKLEDPVPTSGNKSTSAQRSLAHDRAITDGMGVVRNVIYRENNWSSLTDDPAPYRIDIHRMFLGGMGAGAGIADNLAYYEYQGGTHDQLEQILVGSPPISDATILSTRSQSNYYNCGACTYNYYTNANILGVMSCWGGVLLPLSLYPFAVSDIKPFFQYNHNIPAYVGWHGEDDAVIDFQYEQIFFSPSSHTTFYSEGGSNSCLLGSSSPTYTVSDNDGITPNTEMLGAGSAFIYNFLNDDSINIPAQVYLDTDMGHGVHNYTTDNFSCSPSNETDVYKYIVGRSATFFQAVMLGNPVNGKYVNTINTDGPTCPVE